MVSKRSNQMAHTTQDAPRTKASGGVSGTPAAPPAAKNGAAQGGNFVMDLDKIRRDARQHIKEGAVTEGYQADKETVLKLLNDSLATEIVCTLRYKRHFFMAKGINSEGVAAEFAEHATQEQEHADLLAERIVQLGGEPDFAPDGLTARSHSQYAEGKTLTDMIRENLIAERIAIDSYKAIIAFLGDKDVTTRRLFETILAVEEEHADDMADLLEGRE
jgi:bacterioferritin